MEALMIAGAAVSAMGAIKQGQAQAAQAEAAARASQYNATVARNNAQVASEQANAQEEQQRRKFGAIQGQAVAGMAQSGTGFDGTNAEILKQNAVLNELDALTIRYEGQQKSRGLLAQADLSDYEAATSRMNAKAAIQGSYWNAASSLLSAGAKYATYSKSGKMTAEG